MTINKQQFTINGDILFNTMAISMFLTGVIFSSLLLFNDYEKFKNNNIHYVTKYYDKNANEISGEEFYNTTLKFLKTKK